MFFGWFAHVLLLPLSSKSRGGSGNAELSGKAEGCGSISTLKHFPFDLRCGQMVPHKVQVLEISPPVQ